MAALDHIYAYAGPSSLDGELSLATSGGTGALYSGWLERPAAHAAALLVVARTARSRFTLGSQIIPDPVVTCHRGLLRFEALSSCCGVYARYDLEAEGTGRPGATNVDFNPPLRDALAGLTDREPLHLQVGDDAVAVTTAAGAVVERKVALPHRWVKGLGDVQVAQGEMALRLELGGPAAVRLLRSLPRAGSVFVTATGASSLARPGAVWAPGVERLRLLAPLLRFASRLRAWAAESGASAWALDLPGGRMHLVLSPAAARGFSGEGGVLFDLAGEEPDADLSWQRELTGVHGAGLAARGRAGFDLHTGRWFHRDLPFDLDRVPAVHPRLAAARALVEDGRVRLGDGEAWVGDHRVVLGEETCTCPWWGRHAGARGPCTHVLAARIARG